MSVYHKPTEQLFKQKKCQRGGNITLPDRDSNPRTLVDRASILTTELSVNTFAFVLMVLVPCHCVLLTSMFNMYMGSFSSSSIQKSFHRHILTIILRKFPSILIQTLMSSSWSSFTLTCLCIVQYILQNKNHGLWLTRKLWVMIESGAKLY